MPHNGAYVFGDLAGRLDVLRVECPKCSRVGRYPVRRLIEQHGPEGNMPDWLDRLRTTCPHHGNMGDPCGARCPDMVRVFGSAG